MLPRAHVRWQYAVVFDRHALYDYTFNDGLSAHFVVTRGRRVGTLEFAATLTFAIVSMVEVGADCCPDYQPPVGSH